MKRLLILFVTVVLHYSCAQSPTSKPINSIPPEELETGVLLDVRTPEEFSGGHLPKALNINIMAPTFNAEVSDIPKDATIYVYCKMGGRSAKAQERLKSLGYTHVVNLEGGYDAWAAEHKK